MIWWMKAVEEAITGKSVLVVCANSISAMKTSNAIGKHLLKLGVSCTVENARTFVFPNGGVLRIALITERWELGANYSPISREPDLCYDWLGPKTSCSSPALIAKDQEKYHALGDSTKTG